MTFDQNDYLFFNFTLTFVDYFFFVLYTYVGLLLTYQFTLYLLYL